MAAASHVTLEGGGETVVINAPDGPTSPSGPARWVTGQTVDGTRYVYQTNQSAKRLWALSFRSLTLAQKTHLEQFFYGTAFGPTETFSYTHSNGTTYPGVRFLDVSLSFERLNGREWVTQFTLEMPGAVD